MTLYKRYTFLEGYNIRKHHYSEPFVWQKHPSKLAGHALTVHTLFKVIKQITEVLFTRKYYFSFSTSKCHMCFNCENY